MPQFQKEGLFKRAFKHRVSPKGYHLRLAVLLAFGIYISDSWVRKIKKRKSSGLALLCIFYKAGRNDEI